MVPSAAVLGLAPFVHERYAVAAALQFSLQWAVAGSILFALAYVMSVVFSGTYAPLIASWIALGAYALLMFASPVGRLVSLNAFAIMGDEHPAAFALLGATVMPLAIVAAAAWLTERRDF